MGILTGPLSGQGKVGIGVRSVVDYSGLVGGTYSLKAIAVLCINTEWARARRANKRNPFP